MDGLLPCLGERDVVFISHANPEDNSFAAWLSLRLTREGYRVADDHRLYGEAITESASFRTIG